MSNLPIELSVGFMICLKSKGIQFNPALNSIGKLQRVTLGEILKGYPLLLYIRVGAFAFRDSDALVGGASAIRVQNKCPGDTMARAGQPMGRLSSRPSPRVSAFAEMVLRSPFYGSGQLGEAVGIEFVQLPSSS